MQVYSRDRDAAQAGPHGNHLFHNVTVSDHARVIFGNVYNSCPDFINDLTPEQERRGMTNIYLRSIRRTLKYRKCY